MEKFVEKGDCSMTLYGLAAEFFFQKQPFNSVLKKKRLSWKFRKFPEKHLS